MTIRLDFGLALSNEGIDPASNFRHAHRSGDQSSPNLVHRPAMTPKNAERFARCAVGPGTTLQPLMRKRPVRSPAKSSIDSIVNASIEPWTVRCPRFEHTPGFRRSARGEFKTVLDQFVVMRAALVEIFPHLTIVERAGGEALLKNVDPISRKFGFDLIDVTLLVARRGSSRDLDHQTFNHRPA